MAKSDHPGIWHHVYQQLRTAGADTFIKWADLEGMTGKVRDASRSSLNRARQQLECMDGLTVCGQSKDGFWVRRQEHAAD